MNKIAHPGNMLIYFLMFPYVIVTDFLILRALYKTIYEKNP